jgi:type III secretion protein Q
LATADETPVFDYPPGQVLSRRLRRVSPQVAATLRDLFRSRECLILEGKPGTTWRFTLARKIQPPAAILEGAHEKLALSVADDGWCERLGARAWWDFTGESRLLAWSLAHTGLIEGLGRILREPLIPTELTDNAPILSDTGVALGFAAVTTDGRTTRGCVTMSATLVGRLASHGGWRRAPVLDAAWLKIAGTLRLDLCDISFSLRTLAASEVGDVLVLGSRSGCWQKLQLTLVGAPDETPLRTWNALYDGNRLTLTSGGLSPPMELIMSSANMGEAVGNIPVSLDFDLGNLTVPLGELATLKPGYVFELPGNLERLRVAIRANGVRIGQGELVAVGDVLGVQLLSLDVEGVR